MKHIFIGDIHGKVSMVHAALALPGKKIFVGDIGERQVVFRVIN